MVKKDFPKRIIYTAAQSAYHRDNNGELVRWGGQGNGAELNQNLYDGLRHLADEINAEFRILPIFGKTIRESHLHESVENLPEIYDWTRREFEKQNENLSLSRIRVPPQNVDPATSRKHLTSKYKSSLLYPHPKQRFAPTPSYKAKLPRFIATTGCVTSPNYNGDNDRGDQAFRDQVMGGILVELVNNIHYNLRFLSAQRNGKFIDLGKKYDGTNRVKHARTEALVLGDIHWPETDSKSMKASLEQIEFFKPSRLVLHDFMNGTSISHHDLKDYVMRARMLESGNLSLEEELRSSYGLLKQLSKEMGRRQVYVVHSNHDDFLEKYINSDQWKNRDLWNMRVASKILSELPSKDDYLKVGLSLFGKIPSNITFLGLDDNLKVLGYELGSHGHKGPNGSRGGGAKSREASLGKSVSGHTHAPEQFRDAFITGTNGRLDLPFTEGSPSSAMSANFALYDNGHGQLLPIIDGHWKMSNDPKQVK